VFICELAMYKMLMIDENPGYTAWIASDVVSSTTPGCPYTRQLYNRILHWYMDQTSGCTGNAPRHLRPETPLHF
jgi:hypothetical protein